MMDRTYDNNFEIQSCTVEPNECVFMFRAGRDRLSKNLEPTSKFEAPEGLLKPVQYWKSTNIIRHSTKFSRVIELAPGICIHLF